MRITALAAGTLAILALVVVWALGETVILRTFETEGATQETRLWVVDHDGKPWLRSAQDHGWFQRLKANPEVELRRNGQWYAFRAAPSDSAEERVVVNRLMAEKYGVADMLIGGVFDHSMPVVVELVPR